MDRPDASQQFTHDLVTEIRTISTQAIQDPGRVRVFVMGPSLNDGTPAGILRRHIIDRCNESNLAVIAEHDGIRRAVTQELGRDEHLTFCEVFMARKSDLIVIIPGSPGSFAELGYFAFQDDFCSKMTILYDALHQGTQSYILLGPLRAAEAARAKIHFIDYSLPDAAWNIIHTEVEIIKSQRIMHKLGTRR